MHKKTLLIVDDDSDDRDIFCEAVHEMDPSVECFAAKDGEDGLHKLRKVLKQLPDFIFLDLNMPRMDGRRFLTELKQDDKLKNIPVVILTTSSTPKDIEDTRKLGATCFITKPTSITKLCKKITYAISHGQSPQKQEKK
jgi:CheY-like chemotaxis protein